MDALTQLFNSRHFYEQLSRELEPAVRYQRPLSVMKIDADCFKRINDTYGHLSGDSVLRTLASILRDCLRTSDTACRYVSEACVALMPETSLFAAMLVAERLRLRFASLALDVGSAQALHCTISIGVAELTADDTAHAFLRRAAPPADKTKQNGRNRVEGS